MDKIRMQYGLPMTYPELELARMHQPVSRLRGVRLSDVEKGIVPQVVAWVRLNPRTLVSVTYRFHASTGKVLRVSQGRGTSYKHLFLNKLEQDLLKGCALSACMGATGGIHTKRWRLDPVVPLTAYFVTAHVRQPKHPEAEVSLYYCPDDPGNYVNAHVRKVAQSHRKSLQGLGIGLRKRHQLYGWVQAKCERYIADEDYKKVQSSLHLS